MTKYKMVQIPPNVSVAAKSIFGKAPDASSVAAVYLEAIVNKMAAEGWQFMRVDAIGVVSTPGCVAALTGNKGSVQTYYVITFCQG